MNGHHKKYKSIDYRAALQKIEEIKAESKNGLARISELQNSLKSQKEHNLINHHKQIYFEELKFLKTLQYHIESELDWFLCQEASTLEIKEYKSKLENSFLSYREQVSAYTENYRSICQNMRTNLSKDNESIESFRSKQKFIFDNMNKNLKEIIIEKLRLEAELNICGLMDGLLNMNNDIETGIPEEAFNLECPDVGLKAMALEEFIIVDGRYVEMVSELEKKLLLLDIESRDGWSAKDHDIYIHVCEYYDRNKTNCNNNKNNNSLNNNNNRMMMIDMMMRLLPHKNRQEIINHENWITECRSTIHCRQKIVNFWMRDRSEVMSGIADLFAEMSMLKVQQQCKKEERQAQRKKQEELYAKVREWREKKIEALQAQMQEMEERAKQLKVERATEKVQMRLKKAAKKQKIEQYHKELEEKEQLKIEEEAAKLKELEEILEMQAARDKERIEFRHQQYLEKEKKKIESVEKKKQAAEEKEQILEAIRMKVRPQVERDLLRLWNETIAWKEKYKKQTSEVLPIFQGIKTFTSEQIISDPRFRLEQRLRDVGLLNTDHARSAMAVMRPLHEPRKDTFSTVNLKNL